MTPRRMFRRKIYDHMLEWKRGEGSTALLIEGARRVGKTTVVREFARNEYRSHILIDFSVCDDDIKGLIDTYSRGADRFFQRLQELTGTELHTRQSLIVFDEVQLYPRARQLIKHLVEDGRYDYIETGSLISIKENVEDILIPSEEESMDMHPMDFEEFLWAQGNEATADLLREDFKAMEPLGIATHRRILDMYITYMIVGGMPQAVEAFLEDNSFESAERAKRRILDLYSRDMVKINARRILDSIPAQLSRHVKSFSPSMVRKDSRVRDHLSSVDWLTESKIVNRCICSSDPGPSPGLSVDGNTFKLYLLDTGLLITASFREDVADRGVLLRELLSGRLNVNEGMFFENMVAQELVMAGHELVFAKFMHRDSPNPQEVDFLIAGGNRVVPIEVKSGTSSRHKSLDRFMDRFADRTGRAYVIHSKDLRVDGDVTYIPIYMTMFLRAGTLQ